MALELTETTKHARLYSETLPDGSSRGYCRASIAPMHYESVPGSGVFDKPIDLRLLGHGTAQLIMITAMPRRVPLGARLCIVFLQS